MRLPTWDELQRDSNQLDVLEHPLDQPLFVAGPPGSGKTVLAVNRARMLAENGRQATIVTFNRMLRRLVDLLNGGERVARTMHTFAWHDYRRRVGSDPPGGLSAYDWDWDGMLQTLSQCPDVEKEGHLVVDEGQDLPEGFFRYANQCTARLLTVFADDDQALSDRRTTLEQIQVAASLPNPRLLQSNHRNTPEIARLAEHFHEGRLPAANIRRTSIGTLPSLVRTDGSNTTANMIATWFTNRGGSIGVIVDSNSFGEVLEELLSARLSGTRIDRYGSDLKNENSINVNEDGITIVNKESVKGQEFDTVFVLELAQFLPWQNEKMRRTLYMICTRARDYLTLVHGPGPLSQNAVSQLPDSTILERQ